MPRSRGWAYRSDSAVGQCNGRLQSARPEPQRIEQLMRDAVALDRAGVACLFLEGIPREVAAMITAEIGAPTIGIAPAPIVTASAGVS